MKRMVALLLFFFLLLPLTGVSADQFHTGRYTLVRESEWELLISYDQVNRYQHPQEFLEVADNYIEEITAYLGREEWFTNLFPERVELIATATLPSQPAASHIIALNRHRFGLDNAPLAREITSLILRSYNSYTLKIGLSCAMQDRFGTNIAPYNRGQGPHLLAGQYTDQEQYLQEVGAPGWPHHLDLYYPGDDREGLFILSQSFVEFLLEEFGVEALMEVYDSPDLEAAYQEVMGLSLEELRDRWLEKIE